MKHTRYFIINHDDGPVGYLHCDLCGQEGKFETTFTLEEMVNEHNKHVKFCKGRN